MICARARRRSSIASSRSVAGGWSSTASASGVGAPTSGSPVVDMIDVSVQHAVGVLDGDRLRDHPAHRRADDVGAVDAEVVEQAGRVGRHVGQDGTARRRSRRSSAFASSAAKSIGADVDLRRQADVAVVEADDVEAAVDERLAELGVPRDRLRAEARSRAAAATSSASPNVS